MIGDRPERDRAFLYELARERDTTGLVAYLRRADNPVVRRRAAELLGDLANESNYERDEEVIQSLMEAVWEDDDEDVRARAVDSLYRHGEECFERLLGEMDGFDPEASPDSVTSRALTDWLDADRPEFRMVAAAALGRKGDEQTLPQLVEALSDPEPRVRLQAVRSCGLIGDSRCVPALSKRLGDSHQSVRREAASALGSIGTEAALEALVPVARSGDEPVRRIALDELGEFGSLEPLVVLLDALRDESNSIQRVAMLSLIQLFVESPNEQRREVRSTVADQLATLDASATTPQLLDVVAESQRTVVRRNAVWLLGQTADADSDYRDDIYDCLLDALEDDDEATAELAAASLAELDSDELERRLHILVNDESASEELERRAEAVLEATGRDLSKELVTNAVDYTYVGDPADYTKQRADETDSTEGSGSGSGSGSGE